MRYLSRITSKTKAISIPACGLLSDFQNGNSDYENLIMFECLVFISPYGDIIFTDRMFFRESVIYFVNDSEQIFKQQ